jgi:hypothetical protein
VSSSSSPGLETVLGWWLWWCGDGDKINELEIFLGGWLWCGDSSTVDKLAEFDVTGHSAAVPVLYSQ